MAFLLPEAAELVLTGAEEAGFGNIVQGAETVASEFKNEIIKGGIFGTALPGHVVYRCELQWLNR